MLYYRYMNSEQDLKKLSKLLQLARKKKKMTQAQVADKAGINTNYYAVIERGETNPSYTNLVRISEVLGIKELPL